MSTLAAHGASHQQLPALYLSYHVPNFQHPAATCQRIASGLKNMFEDVMAVEVRRQLLWLCDSSPVLVD